MSFPLLNKDYPMKMLYTNESFFLVNNIKNLIEAESIDTFLKNEFAQGAVGEVSAFDAWPEIWVHNESDYEQALAIANANSVHNTNTNNIHANNTDWTCSQCSEINAPSFEICWQCQNERS